MTFFRVLSHGGFVCGVKHLVGFPSIGPSYELGNRKYEHFLMQSGDLKGRIMTGYERDLFLMSERPKETAGERFEWTMKQIKRTWAGQAIHAFLKAGNQGRQTQNMDADEIIKKYYPSGEHQICWEPILLKAGFQRVGEQFYNSNSGNWLREYVFYCTPETYKEANGIKNKKKKVTFAPFL